MDESISHFQRMLDQNASHFQMHLISTTSDPSNQDQLATQNFQQQPNYDHNNFFLSSPNPFRTQKKSSFRCQSKADAGQEWQNESQHVKIQNFDAVRNSQAFFIERQSSEIFHEQSSTQSKNRQSQWSSFQRSKKPKDRHIKLENRSQNNSEPQSSQELEIVSMKKQGSLKNLSQIMFQIVQKHSDSSFRIVASKLVKYVEKQQEKKGSKVSENRIKNITRRVYDGLNVMISSGVIERLGKRLRINQKLSKCFKKKQLYAKQQQKNSKIYKEIIEQINESKTRIECKKKTLEVLTQRKQHLKNFIASRQQSHQTINQSAIIRFPLVSVSTKSSNGYEIEMGPKLKNDLTWDKDNSSTCDSYRQNDFVEILFNAKYKLNGIMIQGDVDFAQRIGRLCANDEQIGNQ